MIIFYDVNNNTIKSLGNESNNYLSCNDLFEENRIYAVEVDGFHLRKILKNVKGIPKLSEDSNYINMMWTGDHASFIYFNYDNIIGEQS